MSEPVFVHARSLRPLFESVDWGATALGVPHQWPPELLSTLRSVFDTRFPVTLLWGPDLVMLYNESYVELIGDKHPGALGRPAREVFPEAWDTIGPLLTGVLAGTGPTWTEDALIPLDRHGYREECWFTFSYSPVMGRDGRPAGVMDIAAETTRQIVDRRRLGLLARLGEQVADLDDVDQLAAQALPLLRRDTHDLPAVGLTTPGSPATGSAPSWDDRLPPTVPRALAGRELLVGTVAGGDRVAWLRLPGSQPLDRRPVLAVLLNPGLPLDDAYLQFLTLVARSLGTALARAHSLRLERQSAHSARTLSEHLQRSLLTDLPEPDHLQLVGRYQPAAKDQQVGGDWYDAFMVSDGSTSLVVGDVTGHDSSAAVAMAQLRNVLRGVGYTLVEPPAAVLRTADAAMRDFALGALATAVLARVEQTEEQRAAGVRLLRWSNAGHPPPLLVHPDGRAELLTRPPELLLGLGVDTQRRDHTQVLEPGSTVLLYTDGLVERRHSHLSEGLAWLCEAVERLSAQDMTLADLCDALLEQVGPDLEDDVAVLALRAYPEDRPRPPEAGPRVMPRSFIAPGDTSTRPQEPA